MREKDTLAEVKKTKYLYQLLCLNLDVEVTLPNLKYTSTIITMLYFYKKGLGCGWIIIPSFISLTGCTGFYI